MKKKFYFFFSGFKTPVLFFFSDSKFNIPNSDLAASVEQAIVDVLVAKTVRAAREYKAKTVLLGGGVSANQKLQKTLSKTIKKSLPNSKFYIPDSSLTTDNAGMIAIVGFFKYLRGKTTQYDKVAADPNLTLKSWL